MMPLFDRIFELAGGVGGILLGSPEYKLIKFALTFLGLFFSIGLIIYWIYLEKKYKWGRWWWGILFNIWGESRINPEIFKKEWKKLQNIYEKNKITSLYKAEEIMQAVLDLYFFEQAPLKTRLEKTSHITALNIERLRMASNAIDIIKQKQKKDGRIEISDNEIISILKEFENGLLSMLVITEEDLWVKKKEQPQPSE